MQALGSAPVSSGFGKYLDSFQSQYAAQLLLIAGLCCAKLSIAAFTQNLTPKVFDRRMVTALELVILVGSSISFLTVAFQCHISRT